MALSDHKIEKFEHPVDDLAHTPTMSADDLQAWFDSSSYELKDSLNGLIDEIETEIAKKADTAELHTHENKAVLDAINEVPVTHEELSAAETNAYDYAVDLNDRTNERFNEYATKEEAQLMCDMTFNALDASKIGDAPSDDVLYGRKNGVWSAVELPESVPTITMAEADTFFEPFAIVEETVEVFIHETFGYRYFNKHLLICSSDYDLYDGDGDGVFMQDSDYRYTQVLLSADGSIKKRRYEYYQWTEWTTVSATTAYVDEKIGDVETALDNIIAKYGLGGDA